MADKDSNKKRGFSKTMSRWLNVHPEKDQSKASTLPANRNAGSASTSAARSPKPISQGDSAPTDKEVISQEGNLRLVITANGLEFYSTLSEQRMFLLKATLDGNVTKYVRRDDDYSVIVTVPVCTANGKRFSVKAIFYGSPDISTTTATIVRASQGADAKQSQYFEIAFSDGDSEFRYIIEIGDTLQTEGFNEITDQRPLFPTIPPVPQMVAFLRAITRRNHTVVSVLSNLRDIASNVSTRSGIGAIDDAIKRGAKCSYDIPQRIKGLLRYQVGDISEHVILAFALFIDLEVKLLRASTLRTATEIKASIPSLYLIIRHFGGRIDTSDWEEVFGDTDVTLSDVYAQLSDPLYADVVRRFAAQLNKRTPIDMLKQLGQEAGSNRAISLAEALRERIGEGKLSASNPQSTLTNELVNPSHIAISEQQAALLETLAESGRHYNSDTIIALSLFVDAEIGFITPEMLDSMPIETNGVEISTYAMLAVAGAFDVNLHSASLQDLSDNELRTVLPCLARLTSNGFLCGMDKPNSNTSSWIWVHTPQAASKILQRSIHGNFTGTILASFPVIDQLSENDLVHLAESGREFIAAFQSDFDKTMVWRRLKSIPEDSFTVPVNANGIRTNYSFISGFCAYHFSRAVIGKIIQVEGKDILGHDKVIMIYRDTRDNCHYKFINRPLAETDINPPLNTGIYWKNEIVGDVDISGLPNIIPELCQSALLGQKMECSVHRKLLNWMYEALRKITSRSASYCLMSDFHGLTKRLDDCLHSAELRQYLHRVIDGSTLDKIIALTDSNSPLLIRPSIGIIDGVTSDDQVKLLSLCIIHDLCHSPLVAELLAEDYKRINRHALKKLMHTYAMTMTGSDDLTSFRLGLRFLASDKDLLHGSKREGIEKKLKTALQESDNEIAFAACSGLVCLCLADSVPLPPPVHISKKGDLTVLTSNHLNSALQTSLTNCIEATSTEIFRWIDNVRKYAPKRYYALPFVFSDGSLNANQVQRFAELIASLRIIDESEDNLTKHRYYTLISPYTFEAMSTAIIETWRSFIAHHGLRLRDMLQLKQPQEMLDDFDHFIAEHDKELYDRFGYHPYLGGDDYPITIHHLKPQERISPYQQGERTFTNPNGPESQIFQELLNQFFTTGDANAMVLRLYRTKDARLEDIETFRHVFTTNQLVYLRTATVFNQKQMCFLPLLREVLLTVEQVGSNANDVDDFKAVASIIKSSYQEEVLDLIPAENTSPRQGQATASTSCNIVEDSEESMGATQTVANLDAYRSLASHLSDSIGVPKEMERQVVNMLLLIAHTEQHQLV